MLTKFLSLPDTVRFLRFRFRSASLGQRFS